MNISLTAQNILRVSSQINQQNSIKYQCIKVLDPPPPPANYNRENNTFLVFIFLVGILCNIALLCYFMLYTGTIWKIYQYNTYSARLPGLLFFWPLSVCRDVEYLTNKQQPAVVTPEKTCKYHTLSGHWYWNSLYRIYFLLIGVAECDVNAFCMSEWTREKKGV